MNSTAGLILLIPLLGVVSICHGGRWHWDPIGLGGAAWLRTSFVHRLLVAVFWLGWSASLLVGLLILFGVA
jgi:hypothetical protein